MAWNSQGGGFDTSPSKDASPSVGRDRSQAEKNGIKPMCIKTIYKSFDNDTFRAVDDTAITQVTVVGKVLEAEMNSQRLEYKIGDASGETLLTRDYINDEDVEPPTLIEVGTYVRICGTLKSFQGAPHVVIHRIDPIHNPNDITSHLLEMTYSYLKMKKGSNQGDAVNKSADVPDQVRMVIQANRTMTGISLAEIRSALPHLTPQQITEAVNFLSGEGFIFSTIDDEHFRSTELA